MPSAAMTLDVYADLFECDLDAVAESVSKMCPAVGLRTPHGKPKTAYHQRLSRTGWGCW